MDCWNPITGLDINNRLLVFWAYDHIIFDERVYTLGAVGMPALGQETRHQVSFIRVLTLAQSTRKFFKLHI